MVASGTFKYVVPRLTCHHEGAPMLHLFCRMTNYEQVQNPMNNIFTFIFYPKAKIEIPYV